jgi:hypothetical protein
MSEAFRLGGWAMYPTLIAGLVLVFTAWRFAFSPERALLVLVKWLYALVALAGTLGFVTGTIKTFIAAGQLPPGEAVATAMIGVGESANNLGLALTTMVLATIGVAVGHTRRRATSGSTLVDPLP